MRGDVTAPFSYMAYEMAKYEIESLDEKAKTLKLTDLNFNNASPGVFLSIFHKPDCPNILRIYWPDRDLVVYYYLVNYHALKTANRKAVEILEKNGDAYFAQQLAIDERGRKTSKYYLRNLAVAAALGEPIEDFDGIDIVKR